MIPRFPCTFNADGSHHQFQELAEQSAKEINDLEIQSRYMEATAPDGIAEVDCRAASRVKTNLPGHKLRYGQLLGFPHNDSPPLSPKTVEDAEYLPMIVSRVNA